MNIYDTNVVKSIKMASNSKQNRQTTQTTERLKTRFLIEQLENADF